MGHSGHGQYHVLEGRRQFPTQVGVDILRALFSLLMVRLTTITLAHICIRLGVGLYLTTHYLSLQLLPEYAAYTTIIACLLHIPHGFASHAESSPHF